MAAGTGTNPFDDGYDDDRPVVPAGAGAAGLASTNPFDNDSIAPAAANNPPAFASGMVTDGGASSADDYGGADETDSDDDEYSYDDDASSSSGAVRPRGTARPPIPMHRSRRRGSIWATCPTGG